MGTGAVWPRLAGRRQGSLGVTLHSAQASWHRHDFLMTLGKRRLCGSRGGTARR